MALFKTNLSTLGELLRALYHPSLIPFMSFFCAAFLLNRYLVHQERTNPSRTYFLAIFLGLMVLIGLTASVWFFCQLDYLDLLFNIIILSFLGLVAFMVVYSEFFD